VANHIAVWNCFTKVTDKCSGLVSRGCHGLMPCFYIGTITVWCHVFCRDCYGLVPCITQGLSRFDATYYVGTVTVWCHVLWKDYHGLVPCVM